MARYIISDHHFGHSNIIEYCDRPFSSVGQMNSVLLERHYREYTSEDILFHLGDVAMDMQTGDDTIEYFQRLDGDVLVRGNHDVGLDPEDAPFPVLDSCVIEHDDYLFYCTHRPEDIPDSWDEWALHGHMHNNDPAEYPFVACDEKRVNVSSELLNYRPIRLDVLTDLLNQCSQNTRLRDAKAAQKRLQSPK